MIDDEFGLVNLKNVKAIPIPKTLLLVNNFVTNTTRFLNHFSNLCQEKLIHISEKVTELEIMLAMLEAKLRSVPELGEAMARMQEPQQQPQQQQQAPHEQQLQEAVPSFPPPPPPLHPPALAIQAFDKNQINEAAILPAAPPSPSSSPSPSSVIAPVDIPPIEDGVAEGMIPAAEHPAYLTFFKMVKVGVPGMVVKQKMQIMGFDSSILDVPSRLLPRPDVYLGSEEGK